MLVAAASPAARPGPAAVFILACALLLDPPAWDALADRVEPAVTAAVDGWVLGATPTELARKPDAGPLLEWTERVAARADLTPAERARVAALRVAALRRDERFSDALGACDAAVGEHGPTAELLQQRAFTLAVSRDLEAAGEAYERILAQVPDAERDLVGLSMLAGSLGRLEEAEGFARAALAADDRDEFAWYMLAGLLAGRQAWGGALDAVDRSLALEPRGVTVDPALPHRVRGKCLNGLGRYQEAAAAARTAIAARPDRPDNYVLLWNAGVGDDHGRPDVPTLAEAHAGVLRLKPGHPLATYQTSYLLHQYGEYAGAADAARRYSRAVPGDVLGPMRWAVSAWKAGDLPAVAEACDAMLAIDPDYELGLRYKLIAGYKLSHDGDAPRLTVAEAGELARVADRLFAVKPDQPANVRNVAAVVYLSAARFADARQSAAAALADCEANGGDRGMIWRMREIVALTAPASTTSAVRAPLTAARPHAPPR